MNREKVKNIIKKVLLFVLNPRLLLCIAIAWMITNGWSYVFAVLGAWLKIPWMTVIGTTYLGLLWIPFTPEKIFTVIIAIFLLRLLFPNDKNTLQVLEKELSDIKKKMKLRKSAKKNNPNT